MGVLLSCLRQPIRTIVQEPGPSDITNAVSRSHGNTNSTGSDQTPWTKLAKTLQGHGRGPYGSGVKSVTFSPNGQYVVSASEDKTIKIWDVNSGMCVNTLQIQSIDSSVAFSLNSRYVASSSGDIRIWDTSSGACVKTFKSPDYCVKSVVYSPNGRYMAGYWTTTIKIWNANSGSLVKTLRVDLEYIDSIAFSPNGRYLASGSGYHYTVDDGYDTVRAGGTVKIWDTSRWACVKTLKGHNHLVESVAFSPNSRFIASGSHDHTVKIWEVRTGTCLKTLEEHTEAVHTVVFSPNGKYVVSGSKDATIKFWDAVSGACIKTLQDHDEEVWSLAFSPNGQCMASVSSDRTVRIWAR